MGQDVLLASRKQFHVHEWEGEGQGEEERGRETERIGGFMRGIEGREVSHEMGRKFYRTVKDTDTNLREA